MYTKNISNEYSKNRLDLTNTDKEVFSHIKRLWIKDKTVLDFGCGDGVYSIKFVEMGAKHVIGVDNSSEMIKLAKTHVVEGVEFIKTDGKKLPQIKNIDTVFSYFVFHHIKDLARTLKVIYQTMNSGGVLIATMSSYKIKDDGLPLKNTVIPIQLGAKKNESFIVENIIKEDEDIQKDLIEAGFKISLFKNIKNKDSKISPGYKYKDLVKKKTTLVIAHK